MAGLQEAAGRCRCERVGVLVGLLAGSGPGPSARVLGSSARFLDLVDRPLLAAVLDPAGAAAGAGGGRVQTEADGDQGRPAQGATWHKNLSDLSGRLLGEVGGVTDGWR